jgi:4-hydroxy-tetrahydrodipicolinate reductase
MGSEACRAVEADPELELVARVEHGDSLEELRDSGAEVAVELTTPDSVKENVRFCLTHGIHCVIGATGLTQADLEDVRAWCRDGGVNAFVAPNFALGAVLMMSFAASAAPHFDTAEIVERHHERKVDAPSGTALRTARLMNDARDGRAWTALPEAADASRGRDEDGVRIHSLRLPGSVAHQEVVLGAAGETLTIRHDSTDRKSFMPGVLLAVKKVSHLDGLVVGLEHLLGL